MTEKANAEVIAELATANTAARQISADCIPYAMVPEGYEIEDLERLLPKPLRKRAKVTFTDHPSFVTYVKKHGSMDECTIYGDVDFEGQKVKLVAIINDNGSLPDNAQWRDHQATYSPIQTVEWKRWMAGNSASMNQEDFATFIEENLGDIATFEGMPTGTDMLAMATEFEATSDKRFKSRINLQGGGANLLFVDQDDPATEKRMKFYDRFSLGLRVFLHGAPYRLDARLKYRHNNGKLTFWYELIRPDRVFESATEENLENIRNETGFSLLYGNPGV